MNPRPPPGGPLHDDMFRLLVEASTEYAIYFVDARGVVASWNSGAERIKGYRADEIVGQPFGALFTEAERAEGRPLRWLAQARAQGRVELEERRHRKDGSSFWAWVTISAVTLEDGSLAGYSVVLRDVSERRRQATLLRLKNAELAQASKLELAHVTQLRMLLDHTPAGIAFLDRNLQYVEVNHALARFHGRPAESFVGRSPADTVPGLWPKLAPIFARVLGGESVTGVAFLFRHADHPLEDRSFLAAYHPVRSADGAIVGIALFIVDETERRRAETVLQRQNEGWKLLSRAATDLLSSSESEQSVDALLATVSPYLECDVMVECVPGRRQLSMRTSRGLTPEQARAFDECSLETLCGAAAHTGELVYAPELTARTEPRFALAKALGLRVAVAVPLFAAGRQHGVLGVGSRTRDRLDEYELEFIRTIGHYVATTRDRQSERRRALDLEEKLRQAQKLEAIGKLAGGVAHDFNNLLTVISVYGDQLLDELAPDDPQHEAVSAIREAGERAAALTSQLLAFSRKAMVEPRVLDLNEVVGRVGRMLRRLIGEDIGLATDLATGLATVRMDPTQAEQVVINLAVNARDAMPNGGQLTLSTRNVELAADEAPLPAGRYAVLEVKDSGRGMTEEVQAHIFEPFFTTKELGKGTGLGLATVYGIVSQAGGHIDVRSRVDDGTTFRVLLPAFGERSLRPSAPRARPVEGDETVLVVEDEDMVRRVARRSLEASGYKVLDAPSGDAALALLDELPEHIHLMLTDMVMPGMNGLALAEAARRKRPALRVLFMSGYTDDVTFRSEVLGQDAAFLPKPFTPRSLTRKVREVLDARAAPETR